MEKNALKLQDARGSTSNAPISLAVRHIKRFTLLIVNQSATGVSVMEDNVWMLKTVANTLTNSLAKTTLAFQAL